MAGLIAIFARRRELLTQQKHVNARDVEGELRKFLNSE
jgi:hypothetical protein